MSAEPISVEMSRLRAEALPRGVVSATKGLDIMEKTLAQVVAS